MKAPRIWVLVGLSVASPMAMAMPDGGVSLIAAAVEYVATTYAAYSTWINLAISVIATAYQQDRARKSAHEAYNNSLKDRMVTVRGATEPRRVVLGRQRVGGVVAFVASTGANREKFVMVIALAGHECDAIEEIYFDGVKMDFDGEYVTNEPFQRTDFISAQDTFSGDEPVLILSDQPIAGTVYAVQSNGSGEGYQGDTVVPLAVTEGSKVVPSPGLTGGFKVTYQSNRISRYARVRKFLGAPGQTVDPVVQSLFPEGVDSDGRPLTNWNATHPMTGCAGLAIFFDYNEDAFQTAVEVSAVVRGAKVYDPRKDSTVVGGSGTHRVDNPSTWEWSENPSLLIGYYAMSPLGGRQPSSAIHWGDVATAANVCDTPVDYSLWGLMADEDGTFLADEDGNFLLI